MRGGTLPFMSENSKFRNLASIRNEPFLDVGRYVMIKLR